jgi:peptide chain release factor 1
MEIEEIKKEYDLILKKLTDPELISNFEKFKELSKEKENLEKILEKIEEIKNLEKEIKENEIILNSKEDEELISLAEEELKILTEKKKNLEKELENLLIKNKKKSQVIVEIRAGVGGEEAALFAKDLFRMYSKYADKKNWKKTVLDCHYSELGGIKQIIFELKNGDVFSEMKWEAGVHRVQRIPITEKSGRIHTSTATVAVLPKPKTTEIKIRPEEVKIDFYKASGPGGQYVNKRMSAVRITHLPTGIVVTSQTERSAQQNKENAMAILEAKIFELQKQKEKEKILKERRSQIGFGKRAEKIRTYNFPQDRVTDHRIKKSWKNLEEILDGNLDQIIESLEKKLFPL